LFVASGAVQVGINILIIDQGTFGIIVNGILELAYFLVKYSAVVESQDVFRCSAITLVRSFTCVLVIPNSVMYSTARSWYMPERGLPERSK